MLTPIAILRGCGTIIQEGDVRKEFLSLLKEKGDIIESIGEIIRGSPSENNKPTSV